MITINDCKQANQHNFKGVDTDVKPVDCAQNSLFFQLNRGTFWYFNGQNWVMVGG